MKYSFNKLKNALMQAPVLALPDLKKPVILHRPRNRFTLGVFTQTYGPDLQDVAYLSKSLGFPFFGWPVCLRT